MPIPDYMNMSDDEVAALGDDAFVGSTEPAAAAEVETTGAEGQQQQEEQQAPAEQQQDDTQTPPVEGEAGKTEGVADDAGAEGDGEEGEKPDASKLSDADLEKETPPAPAKAAKEDKTKTPEPKSEPTAEEKAAAEAAKTAGEKEQPAEIDHKVEYSKLIGTPIKANGREITLKSTDEALRLIQQGAGYAQKMEQLKPARKAAAMLEKAGLLGNEEAVAQMIDLYNGNPEAIVKMAKDLKIDLFSLDMDSGDKYTPASHLQTDATVNFNDTLSEVRNLEGGREALALLDGMDKASKDLIWGNSEAVRQIYDLKQNGVYDTVATELERRRVLGEVPADMPYIVAFQKVGEDIAKANEAEAARQAAAQPRTPPVAEPAKPAPRAPIASGAAPVKAPAPNAAAIAAAAPRAGIGQAKQVTDIYQLTDADIEKMSAPPV